ncbi:hypothetical protein [Staphylococcus epidermidis]|uniref:hypothetical protein n=1 Tax=Staphylococcus epidermidis TaxID=1282 RepID=UPI002658AE98|nr:hypothetical protein [Staphylococcus epidermidis]
MDQLSIKMTMNGKPISKEWIENKEAERIDYVIHEMSKLNAIFFYKEHVIDKNELIQLPLIEKR